MKRSTRLSRLTLAALALWLGNFVAAYPARAAYTVVIHQDGPNVVAEGSGTLNTSGLVFGASQISNTFFYPSRATVSVGNTTTVNFYGGVSGPASFGFNNAYTIANSLTGNATSLFGADGYIAVPAGYTGGFLSGTATYDNATFTSLGFTPGTYVYRLGAGANADTFTITSVVPEPSACALLLVGALGAGARVWRRRRGQR